MDTLGTIGVVCQVIGALCAVPGAILAMHQAFDALSGRTARGAEIQPEAEGGQGCCSCVTGPFPPTERCRRSGLVFGVMPRRRRFQSPSVTVPA